MFLIFNQIKTKFIFKGGSDVLTTVVEKIAKS